MNIEDRNEKRHYDRAPVQLLVKCNEAGGGEKGSVMSFFSNDISIGGIFLQTPQLFPIGTELNLEIKLDRADHLINAKGSVVRCVDSKDPDERGMGLKLEIKDRSEKVLLEQFITVELANKLM